MDTGEALDASAVIRLIDLFIEAFFIKHYP